MIVATRPKFIATGPQSAQSGPRSLQLDERRGSHWQPGSQHLFLEVMRPIRAELVLEQGPQLGRFDAQHLAQHFGGVAVAIERRLDTLQRIHRRPVADLLDHRVARHPLGGDIVNRHYPCHFPRVIDEAGDMTTTSVVVAINDLEAAAIADLATGAGCRVHRVDLPWGDSLDAGNPALANLADTVVLIELPNPALEERLRAAGKLVHVVDHHLYVLGDGSVLDRRQARSSLEQVARLLGVTPLNQRQRLISANDRGFIPALAESLAIGAPETDVATIRSLRLEELGFRLGADAAARLDEALAWVSGAEAAGLLRRLGTGRRVPSDPELILVRAPERHRECLVDAIYAWCCVKPEDWHLRRDILAVFGPDDILDQPITSLFFSGSAVHNPIVTELAGDVWCQRLSLWAGGGDGCFFGATDPLGTESASIGALADRLLDELLTGHRPLLSWRSHFLQLLSTKQPVLFRDAPGRFRFDAASDAVRVYFLHHLQALLVPRKDAPGDDLVLRSYIWQRPGLTLRVEFNSGAAVTVPIEAIRVHLLLRTLMVVEWACASEFSTSDAPLWRQLLIRPATAPGTVGSVAQLLDFNWAARSTGSPYRNLPDGASVTLIDDHGVALGRLDYGKDISPNALDGWFVALLKLIGRDFEIDEPAALSDERGRVISGLVPIGRDPCTQAGQARRRVELARLTTVDPWGPEHSYDPGFAEVELSNSLYDRFAAYGTRYAVSSQSLIVVAHGGFAMGFILPNHLPEIYRRLFLVGQLYAGALNRFAHEGAALSRGDILQERSAFRELHQRFVRFANGLWFEQVSGQLQGAELFDLIRDHLPIAADYAEVTAEIERTDALLDMVDQDAARSRAETWEWIGGIGLVLGLTFSALGMNIIRSYSTEVSWDLSTCVGMVLGLVLFFGTPLTWVWWHRRRSSRAGRSARPRHLISSD